MSYLSPRKELSENDPLGGWREEGPSVRSSANSAAGLAYLPELERAIIKRQLDVPPVRVSFVTLFRYATRSDFVIMSVSGVCAIIAGAILPLPTVVFGSLTGTFQDYVIYNFFSSSVFNNTLSTRTLYFVYLAILEYVTLYIATVGFTYTGEHITRKLREQYLAALLCQNIAFFDKLGAGEVTNHITSDMNLIQDGISGKIRLTLVAVATFVSAFVIGFIMHWKLTLILSPTLFAIASTMGLGMRLIVGYSKQAVAACALGGTIADEALSSIRNATAFSTQEMLFKWYDAHLADAGRAGFKTRCVVGTAVASLMAFVYLNYALSFWQGSRYLVAGDIKLQELITVLLAVIIGSFALGHVSPNVQAFTAAVAAAGKILSTIDRVSPLDPKSEEGRKLYHVEGTLELRSVKHIYPSRPEVVVIDDVNLILPAGKTTALVGASGSGKSTVIGLIERFYEPVGGQVLLDGHDISTLNLRWLRSQMALVSQEPTLFNTTIFENIAHGLIGTAYENASGEIRAEMVIEAAKNATAHDFVLALPEGYDTRVGEHGFLLSDGQKQRIAISRAIISNPKILLLDEATSALDTTSERVVQAALDKAARGRTTITVAHRLPTIRTADNIVVMSEGRIIEQGEHDELLKQKSAYYHLVKSQTVVVSKGERSVEELGETDESGNEIYRRATRDNHVGHHPDLDDEKLVSKFDRRTVTRSNSSMALRGKPGEKTQTYSLWTFIKVLASLNIREWNVMLVAFVFSAIAGGGNAALAVLFAKSITTLAQPTSQYTSIRHDANFWSLMILMLAITVFIAYSTQGVLLAFCSEQLTFRARSEAFRHMLRQDITFFDQDEYTTSALTTFLSTEPTNLAGMSGVTLGTVLVAVITLASSLILSIAVGWKFSLVCIVTVPVLLACGYLRIRSHARFQRGAKQAYESSASYASEAISSIQTVASLTREDDVWNHYHLSLVAQQRKSLIFILKSSNLYAMSESFVFLCIALAFWYGGRLILTGEYSLFQFFLCYYAIIFGAQSAGRVFSYAPDMGKAKKAARDLKDLFDRKPEIDSWSTEGEWLRRVEGMVEFRNVHFRHPTRPDTPALCGLNLTVKPGQYVALVGASGCGKSTTIALLERFYSPLAGGIYIDGKDISSLNLVKYRSFLALVSQEPTLHQGTIRENVLLGIGRDDISEEAIVQACKGANIYDFIISLPDGFNTVVGSKGTLLSGGQKQRVAIARALIRDPKILLLDEATSTLDSESEKIVQAALDYAARGRTTIAVAHRLSTIQNADVIYVLDQGRIVERGKHSELLRKKGRYYELVNLQSLGQTRRDTPRASGPSHFFEFSGWESVEDLLARI